MENILESIKKAQEIQKDYTLKMVELHEKYFMIKVDEFLKRGYLITREDILNMFKELKQSLN